MLRDALAREESCGAHFREEHQTAEGEALRDDARFSHIAAWISFEMITSTPARTKAWRKPSARALS
jgi:succinate dehydrogenase/fumarate reductase flavoprotein subunit